MYDPVWHNFVNSGTVNDYMAYKKSEEQKIKRVKEINSKKDNFKK